MINLLFFKDIYKKLNFHMLYSFHILTCCQVKTNDSESSLTGCSLPICFLSVETVLVMTSHKSKLTSN